MIDTNKTRELHKRGCTAIDVLALCDEIDRLRGVQTPPHGKTVDVSTRVAVDINGKWADLSESWAALDDEYKVYTLTATLPVPQEVEVAEEVEK